MKEVGRNDPCPCGSGKKYKKCCGFKQNPGQKKINAQVILPQKASSMDSLFSKAMPEKREENPKSLEKKISKDKT